MPVTEGAWLSGGGDGTPLMRQRLVAAEGAISSGSSKRRLRLSTSPSTLAHLILGMNAAEVA